MNLGNVRGVAVSHGRRDGRHCLRQHRHHCRPREALEVHAGAVEEVVGGCEVDALLGGAQRTRGRPRLGQRHLCGVRKLRGRGDGLRLRLRRVAHFLLDGREAEVLANAVLVVERDGDGAGSHRIGERLHLVGDGHRRALERQRDARVRGLRSPVRVHQLPRQPRVGTRAGAVEYRFNAGGDALVHPLRHGVVCLSHAARASAAGAERNLLGAELPQNQRAQRVVDFDDVALVRRGRDNPLQVPAVGHHHRRVLVRHEVAQQLRERLALRRREDGVGVRAHCHGDAERLAHHADADDFENLPALTSDVPDRPERRVTSVVVAGTVVRQQQQLRRGNLDVALPAVAALARLSDVRELARAVRRRLLHPSVAGVNRRREAVRETLQAPAGAARKRRVRHVAQHHLVERESEGEVAPHHLLEHVRPSRLARLKQLPPHEVGVRLRHLGRDAGVFGGLDVNARVTQRRDDEVQHRRNVRVRPGDFFPLAPSARARLPVRGCVEESAVRLSERVTAPVGGAGDAD